MDNPMKWLYAMFFDTRSHKERKVEKTCVDNYTVDTCDTADYGYETAIWKDNNDIVIVERYENRTEAENGHKKWVDFCKKHPKSVWSVQLDEEIDL